MFSKSTDVNTYREYDEIVWTGGHSGNTNIQVWLKADASSPSRTAWNERFEIYLGSLQTQTAVSFRWATSDNGSDWSGWTTDFNALANSRYLKQEATLSTSNTP